MTRSTTSIIATALIDGIPVEQQLIEETARNKSELASQLKLGTWVVEFTKVDGSQAIMECTLDPKLLPETEQKESVRQDIPSTLRVYSVDRQGWRSFRVDNVIKFYRVPREA